MHGHKNDDDSGRRNADEALFAERYKVRVERERNKSRNEASASTDRERKQPSRRRDRRGPFARTEVFWDVE